MVSALGAIAGADLNDVMDFGRDISGTVSGTIQDTTGKISTNALNLVNESSDTITGIERNFLATVDSGVDNTAFTANNLINSVANTFQIPLIVAVFVALIILYKLIQNPGPVERLLNVFIEVLERFFNIQQGS